MRTPKGAPARLQGRGAMNMGVVPVGPGHVRLVDLERVSEAGPPGAT